MIISDGMRHKTYNKNIMVGILLAEKALLKFPYVKRYIFIIFHSIKLRLKE
jgi:hypothetical protein